MSSVRIRGLLIRVFLLVWVCVWMTASCFNVNDELSAWQLFYWMQVVWDLLQSDPDHVWSVINLRVVLLLWFMSWWAFTDQTSDSELFFNTNTCIIYFPILFTAILISNKQFFITRSRLTALLWCFSELNYCRFVYLFEQQDKETWTDRQY